MPGADNTFGEEAFNPSVVDAEERTVTNNMVTVSILLPPGGINMEKVEENFIRQAIARTGGNQSAAARLLNISRYALRYRMEKYGIQG